MEYRLYSTLVRGTLECREIVTQCFSTRERSSWILSTPTLWKRLWRNSNITLYLCYNLVRVIPELSSINRWLVLGSAFSVIPVSTQTHGAQLFILKRTVTVPWVIKKAHFIAQVSEYSATLPKQVNAKAHERRPRFIFLRKLTWKWWPGAPSCGYR